MSTIGEEDRKTKQVDVDEDGAAEEETVNGTPKRCVALSDLYSSASPNSVTAVPQKVEAPNRNDRSRLPDGGGADPEGHQTEDVRFYSRRSKAPKHPQAASAPLPLALALDVIEISEDDRSQSQSPLKDGVDMLTGKRKKMEDTRESTDLLLIEWDVVNSPKLHKASNSTNDLISRRRRRNINNAQNPDDQTLTPHSAVKRWVRLMFSNTTDAAKLDGLQCQIYWPLDGKWYMARINGYHPDTRCHHIVYDDGVEEDLVLTREHVKVFVSAEEMQNLSLSSSTAPIDINELYHDDIKFDEAIARFDNLDDLGPGDVIWAKLNGHSAWPAVILDEDLFAGCKDLCRKKVGHKSFIVQFFGRHSFSRVYMKQITLFYEGLSSKFFLKCKQPAFVRGLEEVKAYICEKKLPLKMIQQID